MQLLRRHKIKQSIQELIPRKIAVGYVGSGWPLYIREHEKLESFVVSPRLGTNANAVRAIADVLTWDKVWLHDNLHAKIYIGQGKAVLTSANLSENALEPGGLIEVGTVVQDRTLLVELEKYFEEILKEAKEQYGTPKQKEARLKRLEDENKTRLKPAPPIGKAPTGVRYKLFSWTDEAPTVDPAKFAYLVPLAVAKAGPDEIDKWIEKNYGSCYFCAQGDDYHSGEWLLAFELDIQTESHVKKLTWHFVEELIPDASRELDYPEALLCTDAERKSPRVPFRIDPQLLDAFRNVLKRPKFKPIRTFRRYDELKPDLLGAFDRDIRSEVLKLGKK